MSNISIRKLSKHFGNKAAIDDLSLEIADGEMLVLLGPSGCGKSTLLRCIAGLERADAGTIELGSRVVFDSATRTSVPPYDRNVGFVFQSFALWPHMTVEENVAYPLKVRGQLKKHRDRIPEILAKVRCSELAQRIPSQLSGGQQQRVALARALIAEPKIMLLDEPLSNLDALLRLELRQQLREIHQVFGFTGLFVTHDQAEALHVGNRVALMQNGRIEQIGRPEEVYERPATPFAARFLGVQNLLPVSGAPGASIRGAISLRPPASAGQSSTIVGFRARDAVLQPAFEPILGPEVVAFGGGIVRDVVYLGDSVECVADVDGAALRVALPRAPEWLRSGAAVVVGARRSAILVYVDGQFVSDEIGRLLQPD